MVPSRAAMGAMAAVALIVLAAASSAAAAGAAATGTVDDGARPAARLSIRDPTAAQQQPQPLQHTPADAATHTAAAGGAERSHRGVKPLWPLDGIDIAVLAIVVFSLSLAGGAGIGGGAILVPIFLMLRGWPTPVAVALSNVTILGGSFANFICNVRRHRPSGKRTIDWELILMMEPTTIAGALVGAVLNKLLPNWLTTYLLALLLTLMGLRLFTKGRQAYAKETQLLAAAKAAARAHHSQLRAASLTQQPSLSHSRLATQTSTSMPMRSHSSRRMQHGDVLSRSISRLQGQLLLGDTQQLPGSPSAAGTSLAAAAAAARASLDAAHGASITRRRSLASSLRTSSIGAAAAPVWGADVEAAAAAQQPHEQPGLVVGAYERNTLFQGDVIDDFEPMVALPALEHMMSLTPTTTSEEGADEDAAAAADGSLTQPLLKHNHRAATADAVDGRDQATIVAAPAGPADLDVVIGASQHPSKPPVRETSLPLPHFLTLLALSAWVVGSDIAQGSFTCGSLQYWASQVSVLVPVTLILLVFRQVLLKKYDHDHLPEGHQLPDGELRWTSTTTLLYPVLCSTAGLIAGLFGIGGGVVKGPLMLELGVPADVAAATSATMIMFTAGSACVVYARFGQLLTDYAAVLLVLGFLITLCSQLLTFMLIKLLGRRSVIVFMMVTLMGAATCIMYVQSGLVTKDLIAHPEDWWKFGSLCPAPNRGTRLAWRLVAALVPIFPAAA